MDQTSHPPQPTPDPIRPLSEVEFRYYYSGFLRALKRYRTMTIIGWIVVLAACVGFPVAWSVGKSVGLIDIALSSFAIVAGLALVSQSISSLEAYIRIAVPTTRIGEDPPFVHQVLGIMKDVDEGGWQEAYAAIGKMEELRTKYDLPPLT